MPRCSGAAVIFCVRALDVKSCPSQEEVTSFQGSFNTTKVVPAPTVCQRSGSNLPDLCGVARLVALLNVRTEGRLPRLGYLPARPSAIWSKKFPDFLGPIQSHDVQIELG